MLQCAGPGGTANAMTSVSFFQPIVTLTASPNNLPGPGSSTTLTWTATNATACTASGGWTGNRPLSGSEVTAPLTATTTFTLQCTNGGGPPGGTASVTVTVLPVPRPTILLSPLRSNVPVGGSTSINWTTSSADSCTASGGWSGARPTNGNENVGPLNVATTFTLTCTGLGGSATASTTITVGAVPGLTANAGEDRDVFGGAAVTLYGSGTSQPVGTITNFAWSQVSGPAVTLTPSGANATFTAPAVSQNTTLTFRLVVTQQSGDSSGPDDVVITVRPLPPGTVSVSGRITYAHVPARSSGGLDFAATTQEPARGIALEVLDGVGAVLANTQTDPGGFYSVALAPNTTAQLRARAQLVRNGTPSWSIEVRDVDAQTPAYTVTGVTFSSGSGATQDLAIQSGWDTATRQPNGTRAAAPFAILDTVYRSIQKVLSLNASANFPALTIDWSATNTGGETFYTRVAGAPRIVLPGEAGVDTDEYDSAIVAHEFGHYIEDNFSRSDSVGGPHSLSSFLDPRVAWSEGFATWFAAFALDTSVAVDTFGVNQQQSGTFDVETFNTQNSRGWFNEASVFVMLWDLFDAANDDTANLGAAPIWDIITNHNRVTESIVSIFSFVTLLKQNYPGSTASIDSVVGAQNIVANNIDIFGSTETNNAGQTTDVLPIFTNAVIDAGAVQLRSIVNFGTDNKLSNRRFLRLNVPAPRSVRIQLSAPAGRDPDVYVFRRGDVVGQGITAANENIVVNLDQAGNYVIEILDCDNAGCAGPSAAPAPTDLVFVLTTP
jgi:hypothetical protein